MEISINDLKVDEHYTLTCTSFVYVGTSKHLAIKTNAFGYPKINYISSDYILCITSCKWCYMILNPGGVDDEY
jgi:hypothetical protein